MVLKFDLKTIPDNVTVNEATVAIYPFASGTGGTNGPKSLFRLTTDWEESSVTWEVPWTNRGGDFTEPALASNSNGSLNVWEDYDITTAIKDMVESGGDNYGFIIKFDSTDPEKQIMFRASSADQEDFP